MAPGIDSRERTGRLRAAADEAEARGLRELEQRARLQSEVPGAILGAYGWSSDDARRMCTVELELVTGACDPRHDDPRVVIARPAFVCAGSRIAFTREYEVAVAVPGRVVTNATWRSAMLADGLQASVLVACERELEALERSESARRRFDGERRLGSCSGSEEAT